jgi:hypothetical protein
MAIINTINNNVIAVSKISLLRYKSENYLIPANNPAIIIITMKGMRHPMAAPNFRCRPDLVNGMPICRLILAFAWEIPRNLFQEKPPLFMVVAFFCRYPKIMR